jgi:S-adenosylmethionine hydrolase
VEKLGSLWTGKIVLVKQNGDLVTDFPTKEVEAYAKTAKVWFEFGSPPVNVRGVSPSSEKGKLTAVSGATGFIEISVGGGSAAQASKLGVGSSVSLHFRV